MELEKLTALQLADKIKKHEISVLDGVKEVFSHPAHPYTVGLLNALPKLTGPRERLIAIPGHVADPENLPAGCSFHPRCANCTERCRMEIPAMGKLSDGHCVACFNPMNLGE